MQLQKHTQMCGMKCCALVFLNLPFSHVLTSAPPCGETSYNKGCELSGIDRMFIVIKNENKSLLSVKKQHNVKSSDIAICYLKFRVLNPYHDGFDFKLCLYAYANKTRDITCSLQTDDGSVV